MEEQKIIKETVNEAVTRYFTKDGKEVTEEEFYKKTQGAKSGAQGAKKNEDNPAMPGRKEE